MCGQVLIYLGRISAPKEIFDYALEKNRLKEVKYEEPNCFTKLGCKCGSMENFFFPSFEQSKKRKKLPFQVLSSQSCSLILGLLVVSQRNEKL